jgi:glycosyltransferase involved in cell wall biosynthesis
LKLSRPLRLCFITTFYPPYHFGGDAMFVYRLAQAMAKLGHLVDVVHSVDAYRLQRSEEPGAVFANHPNVTVHGLRSRFTTLNALTSHQLGTPALYGRQIRKILSDGQHDVIHYHNISLVGGPGVLRFGTAVKLYTTHEYWLVCPTHVLFAFNREACTQKRCLRCTLHARRPPQLWRYTGWLKRCTRAVDAFLVPSGFAIERHEAELDLPVVRMPLFIPVPDEVGPRTDEERPYFLYVGRLEKLKGVHDLITLFSDYREADLVIAGDGDYRSTLEIQAQGLDHVRFMGAVPPDDLGGLYRNAIAVLIPSLCFEVFCLIPREAMAYGTPVVARRLGDLGRVVEETGGGLTFSTLDECRTAMERIREDPSFGAEMGRKGRDVALAEWTERGYIERYTDLVQELTQPRSNT